MTHPFPIPHLLFLAGALLLSAATGCPAPKSQPTPVTSPGPQPSAPTLKPRPRFKLAAPETQTTRFSQGGTQHQLSVDLLRLEVHDDPASLASEKVPAETLAGICEEGRDASFLVIEVLVTVDGKPVSDASVKGLFSSVGTEFHYGGKLGNYQVGYVGPAKDAPNAFLHVMAVDALHGEEPWELAQFLALPSRERAEVKFSGQGQVPSIQ